MKTFTRLFSILLFFIGIYNTSQAQATLTINSVSGTPGSVISVPVTAQNIKDMQGFQFTIAYDNTKLEFQNCSDWGGGTKASGVIQNALPGKIAFVYNDDPVNITSGKFFSLNFKIKSGASGDAAITWSDNPTARELSNSVPEVISCTYVDGNVTITGTSSLKADFSADITDGVAPLTVHFTDKSSGNPASWKWDFNNDGKTDSQEQNPQWTYKQPGNYSVTLVISNGTDSDTLSKKDYILVRVNIPDKNLKQVINTYLNKPADYNPTVADLKGITGEINANTSNITSLEGCQYLTNINKLNLSINKITDISPLSGLTKLTYLNLGYNQISDLTPLSHLTNLSLLYLHNNQISDLSSLSGLTNLTVLYLSSNKITSLSPLKNLDKLEWLYAAKNQIRDLTPLLQIKSLTQLQIAYNNISDLRPISGLTKMVHLVISDNPVTDISSLSNLINLHDLLMDNTKIKDISVVSRFTNLTSLYISSDNINDISPLSSLTKLTDIQIAGNKITDIAPLAENTGLGTNSFISMVDNGKTNPLSKESVAVFIPALKNKGVDMTYPTTPNYIAPCYPFPERNKTAVPLNTTLKWKGNFDGKQVKYDVWLGTAKDNLKLVGTGQALGNFQYSFTLSALKSCLDYWWRVRAITSTDTLWSGLWHFQTEGVIASFSADPTSGIVPLTVHFTDQSKGSPTSWSWDFGDGSTSTEQNPSHTYQNAGKYTVKLTVTNDQGSNSETKTYYISVKAKSNKLSNSIKHYYKFDGNFKDVAGGVDGKYSHSVTFTKGIINQAVPFGGSANDYVTTDNYSAFNYCHDGSDFTISVWEKHNSEDRSSKYILGNDIGADMPGIFFKVDSTDVQFIVGRNYPYPAFAHTWDSVLAPDTTQWNHLVITYNHLLDSNQYTLYVNGKNMGSASQMNPCEKGDSFYPMLFGINKTSGTIQPFKGDIDELGFWNRALGADEILELYNSGKGLSYPFIEHVIADFSADTTTGAAPLTVSFTDKSTGKPTSWSWDFGDGTKDTVQNPVHIYQKAGSYSVSLIVGNQNGSDTLSRPNYIQVQEGTQLHFTPVWSGNPYQPMTIIVKSAGIYGVSLKENDEIGVFANIQNKEVCVGSARVTTPITNNNPLSITVSADDPTTTAIDGFNNGGKIYFKLWDNTNKIILQNVSVEYNPSFDKIFTTLGTAIVNLSGYAHFQTIWTGNPYQPMNILVDTVEMNSDTLKQGDEVGVFDLNSSGNKICVGAAIVSSPISTKNPLSVIVSDDDPGTSVTDGFTKGHKIVYEIWKAKNQKEISNFSAKYNPAFDAVFNPLGTAIASLTQIITDDLTQKIGLITGWNMISLYVTPDSLDMLKLLNPLISSGSLVKAIDEKGGFVQNIPGVGWMNTIGNMANTEGYYIKMSKNDTLKVTGLPVDLPFTIPLQTGWNMMGYPVQSEQAAMAALKKLTDSSRLVKTINEAGGFIQNIPGVGWMNTIGNFEPGEGYYVKVNHNTQIIFNRPVKAALVPELGNTVYVMPVPRYFNKAFRGNPYYPMNIVVTNINLEGLPVQAGDEIAAFDKDVCVGVGVVPKDTDRPVNIVASLDDPSTKQTDGYVPGDDITLRYMSPELGSPVTVTSTTLSGVSVFTPLETRVCGIAASAKSIKSHLKNTQNAFRAYPNPAKTRITVTGVDKAQVQIFDIYGKCIYTATPDTYKLIIDLQVYPPGTYTLRIIKEDKLTYKKFVVLNH